MVQFAPHHNILIFKLPTLRSRLSIQPVFCAYSSSSFCSPLENNFYTKFENKIPLLWQSVHVYTDLTN